MTEALFHPDTDTETKPPITDHQLGEEANLTRIVRENHKALNALQKLEDLYARLFKDKLASTQTILSMLFVAALPIVIAEANRAIDDSSGVLEALRRISELAATRGLPLATGALGGVQLSPTARFKEGKRRRIVFETINEKGEDLTPQDLASALIGFDEPVYSDDVRLWLNGKTRVGKADDPRIPIVEALSEGVEARIPPGTKDRRRLIGKEKTRLFGLFNQAQLLAIQERRSPGIIRRDVATGGIDAAVGASTLLGITVGIETLAGPQVAGATGVLDDMIGAGTAIIGAAAESVAAKRHPHDAIIHLPKRSNRTSAPK